MKLGVLFHNIPILEKINWDSNRIVHKITADSRAIEPGDVFVACPGARMDGHDFLNQAILAKASAIVYEKLPDIVIPKHVTAVRVKDSHACLTDLLIEYFGHPDQTVKIAGVTGTNGKTTIAYLLHHLLREKTKAAYLGTLWYEVQGEKMPAMNTTPGPEVLIPLLRQMQDAKVGHCVMEVSSHALEQKRIHGLAYELSIFTQLTQDHLDYHKDMESYFQAKRLFFTQYPQPRNMLINRDCPYGRRLLAEQLDAKSFSLVNPADYQAIDIVPSFQGSRFKMKWKNRLVPFQIKLPMPHNVANVLAVLGGLDLLGYDPEDFQGVLAEVPGIPGRMERVPGVDAFQVFVDYAHTPDAIENVLSAAREMNPKRIITLFGCGGDRDRTKRPLMAQMAAKYSDIIMITSDNPRSEDPELIIQDIKSGIASTSYAQVMEVVDRREAIEKVLSIAEPGDVVFLLGKGHEDYQIIGDKKIPFDDRMVVQDSLKRKGRVFFS